MRVNDGDRLAGQEVLYTYVGNVSRAFDPSLATFIVHDRFTFRLYDSFNASSIVGIASLTIVSGLQAITPQSLNDSSWICEEDGDCDIALYARDSTNRYSDLKIVISSVPVHGSLFREHGSKILVPGDLLRTNCSRHMCATSVMYVPKRNFFNFPAPKRSVDVVDGSSAAETFSFYAIARVGGEHSSEVMQEVQVRNTNDPSQVWCPQDELYVEAVGSSTYASDTEFNPLDRILIEGFEIADPDKGVHRVLIELSTSSGLVSLNRDYTDMLDFISVAYCHNGHTSQCSGTGISDSELAFFAAPSDAQMALNGMVYQSLDSNITDKIKLTVNDGTYGNCLQPESDAHVVLNKCWRVSCTFNVTVGRRLHHFEDTSSNVPIQIWASGGVSMIVLLFLAYLPRAICP